MKIYTIKMWATVSIFLSLDQQDGTINYNWVEKGERIYKDVQPTKNYAQLLIC